MSIESAFAAWVAVQDEAGTPVSTCLRAPLDDRTLRQVERRVGTVPDEVVLLHRLADGIDDDRWREIAPGYPYELVPGGPEFVDLGSAAAVAERMRGAARAATRTMATDPEDLWPPHLALAYPIWPDECIAVSTRSTDGELWIVRWEAGEIRPLGHGMEWILERAVEDFQYLECRWDSEEQILRFDEEAADGLDAFPG